MGILNYVFGDFKTAFKMDKFNKEDLKSSVNVILTGAGAVGIEKVADIYANLPDKREWLFNHVYAGHDTLLKYLSMHGQQELANNILGLAPGQSTELYALTLGVLAAGSAYHFFKNERDDPANKLTTSDYIKAALYKPVSSAFALWGLLGYLGVGSGTVSSATKSAVGAVVALPSTAAQKVIDIDAAYREAVDSFVDNAGNRINSAKHKLINLFGGKKEKPIGANDLAPEIIAYNEITPKSGSFNGNSFNGNKTIRKVETAQVPVDTIYRKSFEPTKRQNSKVTGSASYLWQKPEKLTEQLDNMGFFR